MSEKVHVTVVATRTVLVPTIPNFIRDDTGGCFPIADFTNEQLKQIGEKWTHSLMLKAQKRRAESISAVNRMLSQSEETSL